MATKRIIAVVGATGAQGGGLARAVLADRSGAFSLRALTRNPGSDKAKALAAAGAEVTPADIDDLASVTRAFAGVNAAFCLTNFWEHFSPERELAQARTMAQAAKDAGVQHVIWSTLEDTRRWVPLSDNRMPTLGGKYKVPHFDAKGEADQIYRDLGVPTTFLLTSYYWENLIYFGAGPQRGPDGKLAVTFPLDHAKLPSIAVEDIGKCAFAIFRRGGEFLNRTVGIAGEHLSGGEIAAALTKALKQEVRYNAVTPDVYRSFGFPAADDLGNMFQFKRDFNQYYCEARDLGFTRGLNPDLLTFDGWLDRNKQLIPLN
ncbi:MAG TPA: NmrA/HSCARG family protein [Gemmatimonadales bacterium]|jgi:uncharacterized protein YbjT (DUF2867 family)